MGVVTHTGNLNTWEVSASEPPIQSIQCDHETLSQNEQT